MPETKKTDRQLADENLPTGWYLPGIVYLDEIPQPGPIEQEFLDSLEPGEFESLTRLDASIDPEFQKWKESLDHPSNTEDHPTLSE